MVVFSSFFISVFLFSSAVIAAPIEKRIAQVITDSTSAWVNACTAAGGGQQCQPVSQPAFMSLLAAGGNCDQQNAADAMINLAKQLNNNSEMIRLAQIFVQQPRNAPNSLQVPYCQTAPKNAELNGLFHCQFAGSNFAQFSGDQTGNVPLGLTAVNPPGSCPAKPDGPVPDGVQLNTLVQNPGVPITSSGSKNPAGGGSSVLVPPSSIAASSSVAPLPSSTVIGNNTGSSTNFKLQNGKDAQALNAKFATLTAASACTNGQQACVAGGFAQCVGGNFQITQCSAGTQCFALPLVNKAGTSLACDTQADAIARISASGATGGLDGSGSGSGSSSASSASLPANSAVASGNVVAAGSSGFKLQNGKDAQALNAKFATLTASSACTNGQQACVAGGFAQCVGGKFQITQCSGGTQCFALPLVNKAGTSITCDTSADAASRIAASGASGGITGA